MISTKKNNILSFSKIFEEIRKDIVMTLSIQGSFISIDKCFFLKVLKQYHSASIAGNHFKYLGREGHKCWYKIS